MIRLAKPWIDEEELDAVAEVLRSGMLVQGEKVRQFEEAVAAVTQRQHAIAVANGTAALELALRVIGVAAGDEVLCPALSWPSPGHAIALSGATPAFVDVDAEEWNATADALVAGRGPRTKAAVVIDQFGNPARANDIERALGDLPLIEDAACSLGSHFVDRPCGGLGLVSCISFHPRKIITTGEGGMLLTDDADIAQRLRVLRDHGRDAGEFPEPAGNHRLTEVAAAIGIAQMGKLETIIDQRRAIAARYHNGLGEALAFQATPAGAETNYQTMGALLPAHYTAESRDRFIADVRAKGVELGALSYAMHRVKSLRVGGLKLKNTEDIVARGIALPLYPTMDLDEVDRVIELVGGELS